MMNTKELTDLNQEIQKKSKLIKQIVEPNADKIRVIMVGPTGSGKTSISCSLCQKKLIVRFNDNEKIELESEGVMSGGQSITKFPSLIPDDNLNLLYCDCPGFEDTNGTISEIKNAFMIDSLFQQYNHSTNKVKILLVFSYSDIDSLRRQVIVENIKRLSKMIINPNKLKESVGLVITKCSKRRTAKGLINEINEKPDPILNNWCQYFLKNLDHVFLFPLPNEEDVDKEYNCFDDRERLINFLQNDPLINPQHKIILSKYAEENLERIKLNHQKNEDELVCQLFNEISSQFDKLTDQEKVSKWINGMESLDKVKNTDEFIEKIQKFVPDLKKYDSYFEKMKEFEAFDFFIDRVFNLSDYTSTLQRSIHMCALRGINELKRTNVLINANEETKKQIEKYIKEKQREYDSMKQKGGIFKEIVGPLMYIASCFLPCIGCSIC